MRIPSGVTDQYIYFVAVDATDLKTRETGLTSFTVYRSRNGGAAAAFTTPTVNETDATNMPGVYELLLDEDMTIDAGDDSQEMVFHITQANMAPVTRTIELYRPKITAGNTLDVTATGAAGIDWGNVENPTTAVNLSATNIDVDQVVASVTGAVGSVTGAVGSVTGNVGGNVAGSVGSVTGAVGSVTGNVGGSVASIAAGGISEASFSTTAGAFPSTGVIDQGTAQSATGTTLVLRSAAAFADDELIGATIVITGGSAGVGQSRTITDYASTTDTATVDTWTTTPSGTITYKIFAGPPASASAPPTVLLSVGTGTGQVNLSSGKVPATVAAGDIANSAITAASIASDAITAAKVAADVSAEIADAVWDEALAGHAGAGSAGEALSAAGTAGDPWTTALPGAYGAGTAGYIVGTNINATVSSRASQTSVDTIDDFLDTEVAAILADTNELQTDWANGGRLDLLLDTAAAGGDPWSTAVPGAYGAGTAGYLIGTNLDATVSSRATQTSLDTVDGIVDAILLDTAEIGAAGAGLTALATAADLATVDTVVDAIKAKTDSLTYTVAGVLDINIQRINDVEITGDGSATPFNVV